MKAREKMLKFSSKLILALFVFVLSGTSAFAANYTISDYDIDVNVTTDRTYEVTEHLDVFFTEKSHGIYRAIPDSSSVEKYRIKNVSTFDDESSLENDSGYLNIKIGDPDKTITGQKDYTISYDLVHIKDDADDGDYFYMNLIGTEWDTTIDNAAIKINLPTDQISDIAITSGKYSSSRNEANAVCSQEGNTIYVSAENLNPEEGITLKLKMPEGTFADAPDSFYPFADIVAVILVVLSIMLIFYALVIFFKYGRDKAVLPIMEFYPPDNMNPTQIGYIIDRTVDTKDVTSLIFYWASKGLLNITHNGGNKYTLTKLKPMDDTYPKYEQSAFNKLWSCGTNDSVTNNELSENYYTEVNSVKTSVPCDFVNEKELDSDTSGTLSFITVLLSVLMLFLPSFIGGIYESDIISGLIFGGISLVPPVVFYFVIRNIDNAKYKKGNVKRFGGIIVSIAAFIVGMIISSIFVSIVAEEVFGILAVILIVLNVFISVLIAVFTNQRTEYGQKILERTIGFKEFLSTAEKDKLEMLLEQDPEYFYNILPYAIALDVTNKWANKFDNLVTQPPSWYTDYSTGPFRTTVLCNNMAHCMHKLQNNMTSSPASESSSGSGSFGGGGFSGGGSGGGGGGSW